MASYIDFLSAQIDDEDRPELLSDIRNEQLEAMMTKLYSMEDFVAMTMNFRQTGSLSSSELEHVILDLYSNTDRFVDIKVTCFIVAQCLDSLDTVQQQVGEVIHKVTSPTFILPQKKHC